MEMVNCPRCGKLFTKFQDMICPVCLKEEEAIFQTVKEFLTNSPESSISEVSEATGASQKKILKYIRDGRLEATTNVGGLQCDKCGRPIKTGRYCEKCVISINSEVSDLFNRPINTGPRMHNIKKD